MAAVGLLVAAGSGDVEQVRRLVAEGCDLEEADAEGDSAVLHAARGGHVEVLNVLLFAGANMRHANMEGFTALLEACHQGHVEAVRFLIEETRYPDVGRTDVAGRGALICAASKGHAAVVRYLISHQYADLEQADDAGMTALLWAARRGRLGLVRYLADEAGVRLLQADRSHWTALLWAAYAGHLDVVEYLVSEKNASQRQCSRDGLTALHCAALAGRTEVARYLLDFCPEPEQQTRDGSTALLLAASKGRLETARMLLFERGANLRHRNAAGRSALDIARRKGHAPLAQFLVLCSAEDTSDSAWRRLPLGHDLSDAVRAEVERAALAGCLAALWLLYCNGRGLTASGRPVRQTELLQMCRVGGHPSAVLMAALGEEDPSAMLERVKEARRLAANFSFLDNAQRSFHSATEKRVLSECRFRIHEKLLREGRQVGAAPSQEVLVEKLLRVTADDTPSSQVRSVREILTAHREGASPAFHSLYYDIMTVMDLVRPLSELQSSGTDQHTSAQTKGARKSSKGNLSADDSIAAIVKELSRVASLLEPPELSPIIMGGEDFPEEGEPSAIEELGEGARSALADAVRAILKHYQAWKGANDKMEARIYTLVNRWRRISSSAAKKLTMVQNDAVPTSPGSGLRFHEIVYERPRAPGVEYAFAMLHKQLSGIELLPSCLFVAEQNGNRQVMVARPTSGFSLQFLLESHRDLLTRIDMESFSALVLTTLLAPPSNSNWANTSVSLEGDSVRLVATGGSDMGVGDRRVHVHPPGSARQGQPYVRSRCALWFLPQMHASLHPSLVSRILATSPEETLLSWLAQMELQHGRYEQLINDEVITAGQYGDLGLPIRCKEGLVPCGLVQLHKVRATLQENSQATHWDLLELLAPSLAEYYSDVQRKVEASLRPEGWAPGRGESDLKDEVKEDSPACGFDVELLLACCFQTYKDSAPSMELLQALADNTFDPGAVMTAVAEATHAPSSQQLISVAEAAEELLEWSDGNLLEDHQQQGVLRSLRELSCLRRLHFRNYRCLEDASLQSLLERAKEYSIAGVKCLRLAGETSLTVGALRGVLKDYPLLRLEIIHEHCTPPPLEECAIGGAHLRRQDDSPAALGEIAFLGSSGELILDADFSSAPSLDDEEGRRTDGNGGALEDGKMGAAVGDNPASQALPTENGGQGCFLGNCAREEAAGEMLEIIGDCALERPIPGVEAMACDCLEVDFSTAPKLEGIDTSPNEDSELEAGAARDVAPPLSQEEVECEVAGAAARSIEQTEACNMAVVLAEEVDQAPKGLAPALIVDIAVDESQEQDEEHSEESVALATEYCEDEALEQLEEHREGLLALGTEDTVADACERGKCPDEATQLDEGLLDCSQEVEEGLAEQLPRCEEEAQLPSEEHCAAGCVASDVCTGVADDHLFHAEGMAARDLLHLLHELKGRATLYVGAAPVSVTDFREPRQLPLLIKQGEADEWILHLFVAAATSPWVGEAADALAAAVTAGNSSLAATLLAAQPATEALLALALTARRGACVSLLLKAGASCGPAEDTLVQSVAAMPTASATRALRSLMGAVHCEEAEELLLRACITDVQALQLVPSAALLSRVSGVSRTAASCLLARAACLPSPPRPPRQQYHRRALVVAVATERMRYAEVDGTRLALQLQMLGFSTTLLAGCAARKDNVLDAQWRLLQAPADTGVRRGVVLVFIGEAWQGPGSQSTMWLRLAGFDERLTATTGIDIASWVHAPNDSGAHHVLNVLDYWGAGADCCIGLVDASPSLSQEPPLAERQALLARPGRCLFTAALPADEKVELLHARQSGAVAAALLQLLRHGDSSLGRRWMTSEELAAGTYRLLREADCPCQIYVANRGEGSLVFDS